jgi:hypothetical protein
VIQLKASLSSLKGRLKTRICNKVTDHFNFSSAVSRATENRAKADGLLEEANFHCKVSFSDIISHLFIPDHDRLPQKHYPDKAKGPYRSELLQQAIEASFFRRLTDLGIKYSEHFNPMPVEVIAMVCATVSPSEAPSLILAETNLSSRSIGVFYSIRRMAYTRMQPSSPTTTQALSIRITLTPSSRTAIMRRNERISRQFRIRCTVQHRASHPLSINVS